MKQKYVIFKDDDVGKDLYGLKKWVDIVLENDAKATIGLIGNKLKDTQLVNYLNKLDSNKIEVFCHGYYHSYIPFLAKKILKRKIMGVEFDRTYSKQDKSLKKYREIEKKHLKKKAISFGPPGNIYNKFVFEALKNNDFKMMFSWQDINKDLVKIPLSSNFREENVNDFIKGYENCKDQEIYTLQFHHADLTSKNLETLPEVIAFLKNKEKRVFVTPSELYKIYKKEKSCLIN